METPSRFWLFFVAVPLFAVGGFCLQAGFSGAGLRYAAGEAAPVVKDTMGYLREDPATPSSSTTQAQRGCPSCGSPTASGSRFCASCGAAVS